MSELTTFEHRRRLLHDILYEGPFGRSPLEVNADYLLTYCFCDFDLDIWCRAVGVAYDINRNPEPEFRSKVTIIFYCAIQHETNVSEEL